ncbi:MAG: hypothetical protein KC466_00615 [Myxococcales bacterium]|nr:hypothetical protein [Myxococcales bacterium]
MANSSDTLLKRILSLGEERLQDLSNQLLDNKAFAKTLEQAVERGLKTKKNVDKNMQTALGLMNLPSKRDFKSLNDKIESLNGKIVSLSLKVDKLVAGLDTAASKAKAPAKAAKAPAVKASAKPKAAPAAPSPAADPAV